VREEILPLFAERVFEYFESHTQLDDAGRSTLDQWV